MRGHRVLPILVSLLACWEGTARAQPPNPAAPPASTPAGEEIDVAVGETHLLSARNVRNYSDAVAGVVDIKLTSDGNQFILAGRKPGSTTLLLIYNDGSQQTFTVNVFARPPSAVEHELEQLLQGFSNVRVTRIGSRHVIEGWVQDEKELALVNHIAGLYPGQVESLVRIGAPVPTAQADSTSSARRFLVRIDFYFVELDTSSSYAVGIGWPGSIGGPNVLTGTGTLDLTSGQVSQAAITVNQPLPRLDMAATHGWGRVLKHVAVITNSGSEAKFSSGGEQNFLANTGLTVGLQKVTFGVRVTVVPRFDPTRRELELQLSSEVSDLTAAGTGTTIPGRTESTLDTVVDTRIGQSIVLSGVHIKTQTHSVSGLPLLSQIPVLGLLFGSHQNEASETEGAIYIVPSVIEGVDKPAMDLVDEAVRRFDDFSGSLGNVRLMTERPRSPQ